MRGRHLSWRGVFDLLVHMHRSAASIHDLPQPRLGRKMREHNGEAWPLEGQALCRSSRRRPRQVCGRGLLPSSSATIHVVQRQVGGRRQLLIELDRFVTFRHGGPGVGIRQN